MLPSTPRTSLSVLALGIVLASAAPSIAGDAQVNRWSGMSSIVFTQGFVQNVCPSQPPCEQNGFGIGDDTNLNCVADPGNPYSCFGDVLSHIDWTMGGQTGHFPGPPPADVPESFRLDVTGELTSPDVLRLFGQTVDTSFQSDESAELAVFRFAGDPTVFDGVQAGSVTDLVDLGLIDSNDVLFVETLADHDDLFQNFEFFVDVTGVAPEQLVVFASGNGPFPPHEVPAVSTGGAIAPALALMVLGWWIIRRRRRFV